MTIGASTISAYDLNFPSDAKRCACCTKSFIRMQVPMRLLANGRRIDPNQYCTKCETDMAREARAQYELGIVNRGISRAEIDRMERECIRKEAFDSAERAMKVAQRSRARHKGDRPCHAYRCTVKIDGALYPERARPHWHIGANREKN